MIHLLKIFLLAFVQGVTEFFPVSSSGHLVVFQHILNFESIPLLYDIFFHLGTMLAVVIFFFKDLKNLTLRFYQKENARFLVLLGVASIPTAVIGLLFKSPLEALFEKPVSVGYALLGTGAILILARYLRLRRINIYATAFIIGVFQGIAIIPGFSRSGLTISIALILAMGYEFSFKFSFILSIPAIVGATILEIGNIPLTGHLGYLITGLLLSALFGLLALFFLKKIIIKRKFHYFAWYCLPVGLMVIIFI